MTPYLLTASLRRADSGKRSPSASLWLRWSLRVPWSKFQSTAHVSAYVHSGSLSGKCRAENDRHALTRVSTGKRISQKLLRNCVKFLSIIHDVLKIAPMEYVKQSSDEVDIRGPESKYDSRKINSYPSKVTNTPLFQYTFPHNFCCSLGCRHTNACKHFN